MTLSELEVIVQTITDRIWKELSKNNTTNQIWNDNSNCDTKDAMKEIIRSEPKKFSSINRDDTLIVESISFTELSEVAYLMPKGDIAKKIVEAILKGKNVCISQIPEITNKVNGTVPYALKKQWQNILEKCKQYGISFGNTSQSVLIAQKGNRSKKSYDNSASKPMFITVAKLVALAQAKEKLPTNAKLTPLAQDYIREHNLNL